MKKILILMMILSLLTLCACRNSAIDDLPDGVEDPVATDSGTTDPTEDNTIEWETPIDIDDSFQQETENEEVEATSGGGAVKVVVNGKKELVSIKIDPDAVDPDDVETLEDLVKAAVNEGIGKADEMMSEKMGAITGGLNIPGLF